MKIRGQLTTGLTAGLVMLAAGCQWLSPNTDRIETPTPAAAMATAEHPSAPENSPTPGPTPSGTPAGEHPSAPENSPTPGPIPPGTPAGEHPYQDNFWRSASVTEAGAALDQGADIHAPDDEGRTPLHVAAAFNSEPGVTELLLDHGGDIHDGDTRDWTPLHHAAASNMTDVVAVKGGGKTYHCGGEKVYHRGNA